MRFLFLFILQSGVILSQNNFLQPVNTEEKCTGINEELELLVHKKGKRNSLDTLFTFKINANFLLKKEFVDVGKFGSIHYANGSLFYEKNTKKTDETEVANMVNKKLLSSSINGLPFYSETAISNNDALLIMDSTELIRISTSDSGKHEHVWLAYCKKTREKLFKVIIDHRNSYSIKLYDSQKKLPSYLMFENVVPLVGENKEDDYLVLLDVKNNKTEVIDSVINQSELRERNFIGFYGFRFINDSTICYLKIINSNDTNKYVFYNLNVKTKQKYITKEFIYTEFLGSQWIIKKKKIFFLSDNKIWVLNKDNLCKYYQSDTFRIEGMK